MLTVNPCPQVSTTQGRVHSVETAGTVDGPGIRFIAFMTGCPLRCQYCHNPDAMRLESGGLRSTEDLLAEIAQYKDFLKRAGGGVTLSGGEPLMQASFTASLLRGCKEMGLHTAVDTSGFLGMRASSAILEDTDLFLLDIKSFDPETYKRVTGRPVELTLQFARHLDTIKKPVWIRFVLVPGLTDAEENVAGLAQFVSTLSNVERVEVLPFHKMGEYKWESLNLQYQLGDTPEPTDEQLAATKAHFEQYGLTVY